MQHTAMRFWANARIAAASGLLLAFGLAGCAVYAPHGHGHGGYGTPAIPKGHMPPPGECRIWIPGKPPGQQSPPGDCRELQHHVPPGAYLVHG